MTGRRPMKICYARVPLRIRISICKLKVLKKAGCQKIFREKVSRFLRQRPEFTRMLDSPKRYDRGLETGPAHPVYSPSSEHDGDHPRGRGFQPFS